MACSRSEFVDDTFGLPTVTDILTELEKPGRDPRPAFKTATFAEGVEKLADLTPGMVLEGVVTNVAAFGAFVDIGVHQDGLVHVSAMSNTSSRIRARWSSPATSCGSRCSTWTCPRKRISLTLRLEDEVAPAGGRGGGGGKGGGRGARPRRPEPETALAHALRRAGLDPNRR